MPHQWEAEQTIEPSLALQLVQEQFPHLHAEKIRLLGAGWDNTAFVINEEWIFRFPRRKVALPLLEAEWCFLPKIGRRLPFPIPIPEWKGVPSGDFPWLFIGYKMLQGFTACHMNLSEDERSSLAEPIARFLAILHATPSSLIATCHIPADNLSRIDPAQLHSKIQKNVEELALLGLVEKQEILERLASIKRTRSPAATAIVHGDFYVRHLLVDENHKLCGVIDWGDVHYGDPAIDLAIAHSFLPPAAHAKFKQAYGNISNETWELAKLRAISSCTYLALFGHHAKDPALLREGMRLLQ